MVAAGSALLVVFLASLAANPEAHAHFHGATDLSDYEHCAVTLFANGVSLGAAPAEVIAPNFVGGEQTPALPEKLFLIVPRYLRQPERGPPAS